MTSRSKKSGEGKYVPGNLLEKMHERLISRMQSSGLTVTQLLPPEGDEFRATFPPSRRRADSKRVSTPTPAATGRSRKVSIGIEWGYELHSVTLSAKRWAEVKNGAEFVATSKGWYEGTEFTICWQFNCGTTGSLVVSYGDDGADGFVGSVADAVVVERRRVRRDKALPARAASPGGEGCR